MQAVKIDLSGELMAKYTLPSIALMGLCTAFLQGGVLQLASIFSAVHIRVSLLSFRPFRLMLHVERPNM